MRAKLYRNISKFGSYSNSLYINIYAFKVFRNNTLLSTSDRAVSSYFIRSRKSNLCAFKTHCFFSSNGKSIYRDYFLSRFELKRFAITGSLVGLKVSSWLFIIFFHYLTVFNLCTDFIQLLVCLTFARTLRPALLQSLSLTLLDHFCFILKLKVIFTVLLIWGIFIELFQITNAQTLDLSHTPSLLIKFILLIRTFCFLIVVV